MILKFTVKHSKFRIEYRSHVLEIVKEELNPILDEIWWCMKAGHL